VLCFDYVAQAWDDTCGGGVWWSQARSYKNAITNELFLMGASTLHLFVHKCLMQ
jgi:predicted alpha-1,6-mannanase (GH76 family)